LLLFWQFTIKTLEEVSLVSNQHMAVEMFLVRLIYLKEIKNINVDESGIIIKEDSFSTDLENRSINNNKQDDELLKNTNKTIGQIKNITQEKKHLEKTTTSSPNNQELKIDTFADLINLCSLKKEIKLKHELETNVNLVSFENNRIEISFNERLDKEFIKNLSTKLYEWTNNRWIISLSKKTGAPSKKEGELILKKELLEKEKKSELYKKVLENFPDAELIDVDLDNKKNND